MNNMDFSSPTFIAPTPEKKSGSSRWWLLACSGCLGFIVLACCCCVGLVVFSLRQPVGLVQFWGGIVNLEDNETFIDMVVCENSQAKQYSDQLRLLDATFTNFTVSQEAGGDAVAIGDLDIAGQATNWEATFVVVDGGTFGRCIDRIDVTSGGTLPTPPSTTPGTNPFTTPTPTN